MTDGPPDPLLDQVEMERGLDESSPDAMVKIQYLRLVRNFVDRNPNKHLLMTLGEVEEVRQICVELGLEGETVAVIGREHRKLMAKGTAGIITKLVEAIKKETPSSLFRYICRSIVQ